MPAALLRSQVDRSWVCRSTAQLLRQLRDIMQEAQDNEPQTLGYQVYTDRDDPNVVHIYERSAAEPFPPQPSHHTISHPARPTH